MANNTRRDVIVVEPGNKMTMRYERQQCRSGIGKVEGVSIFPNVFPCLLVLQNSDEMCRGRFGILGNLPT